MDTNLNVETGVIFQFHNVPWLSDQQPINSSFKLHELKIEQ